MYSTSLTHLGNISGYNDNPDNVYGAEMTEAKTLTPYYERVVHYIDQKPWINQSFDKTYNNYYKQMNETPVVTYREYDLSPVSQDNYEFIENFNDYNYYHNNNNFKYGLEHFDQKDVNNNDGENKNFYGKMLLILFVMFIIYQLM
jgi:hypothetical protein